MDMSVMIAVILVVWFLWALLFCLALGAAAAGPTPRPGDLTVAAQLELQPPVFSISFNSALLPSWSIVTKNQTNYEKTRSHY